MKNILIIGAGVIGLSVAYELSKKKREYCIYVLEKNNKIGLENTIKNSQVIHSGVYYKKNSLKNYLCNEGKKLIYKFCIKNKIKHKKTEKLFVACTQKEKKYLALLKKNSIRNGVKDVRIVKKKELNILEPKISATEALLSPSSGVFDVKTFIKKLFIINKKKNVKFRFNSKISKLKKKENKFLSFYFKNIVFDYVVNCAGTGAIKLAKKNFPKEKFPIDRFVRGVYFKTKQNLNLKRIIYRAMVPGDVKERIDTTPLLDGGYLFGPSVENTKKINKKKLKYKFFNGIKDYLPNIKKEKIKYFKQGVRTKIKISHKVKNEDFYIKKMKNYPWINLFGIESPGLTSSLSIGKYVRKIL